MLKMPKVIKTTGEGSTEETQESPLHASFNSSTTVGRVVLDFYDPAVKDITIDAPPGSGKTTALVLTVKHLVSMSPVKIIVVTPTRTQVVELVERLMTVVPASAIHIDLTSKADIQPLMAALAYRQQEEGKSDIAQSSAVPGSVTVSTISRQAMKSHKVTEHHCLVVDEAYQVTYGDYSLIERCAEKHIFVGDPGQIGPVVTAPAQLWSSFRNTNPTQRLQDVIRTNTFETTHYSINETWRLGKATTEIVGMLYDFEFESKRPPTQINVGGRDLAEIEVVDVHTPLSRLTPDATDSIKLMRKVASRVKDLLDSGEITVNGKTRHVTTNDIAIIAAYNYQVEEASLVLRSQFDSKSQVEVLTADRAQGKEWPIVLAVDPACIPGGAAAHTFSTGRLAVMLSRHSGHLTWYGIHPDEILYAYGTKLIAQIGLDVREAMYKQPVVDEM